MTSLATRSYRHVCGPLTPPPIDRSAQGDPARLPAKRPIRCSNTADVFDDPGKDKPRRPPRKRPARPSSARKDPAIVAGGAAPHPKCMAFNPMPSAPIAQRSPPALCAQRTGVASA